MRELNTLEMTVAVGGHINGEHDPLLLSPRPYVPYCGTPIGGVLLIVDPDNVGGMRPGR